jgi:hypothetical protein
MKISFTEIAIFGWLLAPWLCFSCVASLSYFAYDLFPFPNDGSWWLLWNVLRHVPKYMALCFTKQQFSTAIEASNLTSWEVTLVNVIQNVGKVSCTVQSDREVLTHLACPKNFTVCSRTVSGKSLRFFLFLQEDYRYNWGRFSTLLILMLNGLLALY